MVWFHREYNFPYWFSRTVVKLAFHTIARITIKGEMNVPDTGGVLLVSNHMSHLDPPLIGITCDHKVHFLAKDELFRGLIGWFMCSTGQIRVERGKGGGAVEVAVESLNRGLCLCIFPEGTRSRTGEMQRPYTGVVVIAAKANCSVVPVLVEGTFEMMPPKTKFPRLFKKVRITYGKPFYLSDDERDLDNKEIVRRTAERIMERIKALSDA